jgi:hypothetical protein
MAIRDEILEEILKEYKNPQDLIGKDGILKDSMNSNKTVTIIPEKGAQRKKEVKKN